MPLVWLSQIVGWILGRLPERLVETFCRVVGALLYRLPIARLHLLRSNLHHAFPERDAAWRRAVGVATCQRLVEMAAFALVSPFLSERRLRTLLELPDEDRGRLEGVLQSGKGAVMLLPHVTLFELMAASPLLVPDAKGHGAMFRPLPQGALNDWVTRTRERWGIDMLSRQEGINGVNEKLRESKTVTVLFDQHVGRRGKLIFFMDRLATATHLPGLLAKRFGVPAHLVVPERVGFWRARLTVTPLSVGNQPVDLAVSAHRALASRLRESSDAAADWLWFHGRWATRDDAEKRFHLPEEDCHLRESLEDDAPFPKRYRLWIRMPNWLGDSIMAIPLLRAIRLARPDAEITLLAQSNQVPVLEESGLADEIITLPAKGTGGYFSFFWRKRHYFPDTVLCLTNSARGDLEAWLTRAPQRLGLRRQSKPRPLLTDAWKLPQDLDETATHQLAVWERMMRAFALRQPLDRRPLERQPGPRTQLGLICGTENTPEKRWPVDSWRRLISLALENDSATEIVLFGTANDAVITAAVGQGFPSDRVIDRAGKTDLRALMREMRGCRAVVCNDTGGMHLASLLGIPLVAIFGPTNPLRTGPVFDSPKVILQPPGCPSTGGRDIAGVTPEMAWQALADLS